MSSHYYILDTEQESDQCRQQCFDIWVAAHSDPDYLTTTIQWSEEQTRLTDNKYIVPYCDLLGDGGYTIEHSTSAWFPEEEY
jgi:hypothetical protein